MQLDGISIKPLVILPNTRGWYALVSLLSVGAVALVAVSILAIAALMYTSVFVLGLFWTVFIQVNTLAMHDGPLTQVLLMLVFGWILSKLYPAIWKAVQAATALFGFSRGN